jgi:hypothetical protein
MTHICPVCGFPHLKEPPRRDEMDNGGSQEICPSCGVQFGYDDHAGGDRDRRREFYVNKRKQWISAGMKWHSRSRPHPTDWDPVRQLQNVGGRE